MDNPIMRRETPWLDMPLVFSGNYREYACTLSEAWQCDYQQGYWRFWYEADHRYALPTIALFLSVVIVFAIAHVVNNIIPLPLLQSRPMTTSRAFFRYLSYRTIRVSSLDWNTAPVGLLMLAAVGVIFFFSMTLGPQPYYWPNTDGVDYGSSPPIATRAGWMGLACMPFVFATAGKANLITLCTGVSHERLQVFHRWIAYAFFILALVHTFPFIVYNFKTGTMSAMWNEMVFYWTGVVALVAQAWLTFASWSPLRAWCYEWFKFSHYLAALVFVLFFFFHCDATLTAWDYFVATGVLFTLSWLYRHIRVYFEHGIHHRAELSQASNGFIRVDIPTTTTWAPGQHYFIRFMILGLHAGTIHPFTVCSLPVQDSNDAKDQSKLVFFIRPRGGFTARLARFVESNPNATARVLLDGPYGGVVPKAITNSRRMLVIAGGSGAGWAFPLITAFLKRLPKGESATNAGTHPSLRVVLAARDLSTVEWFENELQKMLASLPIIDTTALEVEIYNTRSQAKESSTASERLSITRNDIEKALEPEWNRAKPTVNTDISEGLHREEGLRIQHLNSRPDLASIVAKESGSIGQSQNLSVFVCGPLGMQNDVSNAVAAEQLNVVKRGSGDIYLHMEHFSWA